MFLKVKNRNLINDYSYNMIINTNMIESINKMVNDEIYCVRFPSNDQNYLPIYLDREDAQKVFEMIGTSL